MPFVDIAVATGTGKKVYDKAFWFVGPPPESCSARPPEWVAPREEGMQFHSLPCPRKKIDVLSSSLASMWHCTFLSSWRKSWLSSPHWFLPVISCVFWCIIFSSSIISHTISIFYLGSILRGHECIIILDERGCCCAAVELNIAGGYHFVNNTSVSFPPAPLLCGQVSFFLVQ